MHSYSKFLPQDFSSNARLGIIAGRGIYPVLLSKRIKQVMDPYLVALDDETDQELYDQTDNKKKIKIGIGQIGKLLSFLKKNEIKYIIMAGQIQPKKLFNPFHFDLKAISILAKLKIRNAETIFGAVAKEIENLGTQLLDARSFMDEDLATAGNMTKNPCNLKPEHIEHGITIAKEIARLNIGQSVVCRHGTVLAVEDFAGTNDLIKNSSKFKLDDAFLVKVSKNRQDFRFDVPVFGQQTLNLMYEHGLKNAILEKNSVIILNKTQSINYANSYKISLIGV